MQVSVQTPNITGDTVHFSWTQSAKNPFQEENAFYFRYESLELSSFSTELFFEIFLALQLRVFAGYDEPVHVHFPTPIPAYSAAYWLAYHNATNVSIDPIASDGGYNPWSGAPAHVSYPRKKAVFFGGGKDSTLATCLLSEIYGADNVVLIQFVGPLRNSRKLTNYLEERQEGLMLTPARNVLGVATQRGWTNYQALFRHSAEHLRPHLELYSVGALPAMLAWGVDLCSLGTPWSSMTVDVRTGAAPTYRYAQSRPEALDAQSRHYLSTFGAAITVTDVVLPFHSLAAHWMLVERYPHALPHIVSCTIAEPDVRWCHQCTKCALFAIMSLTTNTYASDFDYEFFFTRSNIIQKLIQYAESGVENSILGNAPWVKHFFSAPSGYILGCHMVARIRIDELSLPLSSEALANVALWCALYGNRLFPEWEGVPQVTLDVLGPELGPTISNVIDGHLEIIDHIPRPCYSGNVRTNFEFAERMVPAVALLDHIRE